MRTMRIIDIRDVSFENIRTASAEDVDTAIKRYTKFLQLMQRNENT